MSAIRGNETRTGLQTAIVLHNVHQLEADRRKGVNIHHILYMTFDHSLNRCGAKCFSGDLPGTSKCHVWRTVPDVLEVGEEAIQITEYSDIGTGNTHYNISFFLYFNRFFCIFHFLVVCRLCIIQQEVEIDLGGGYGTRDASVPCDLSMGPTSFQ